MISYVSSMYCFKARHWCSGRRYSQRWVSLWTPTPKSVRLGLLRGRGGGWTDSQVPGVGEGPEAGGGEEEGYGVVVGGIFKRFGPGVHNVVDREELVLDIFDGES